MKDKKSFLLYCDLIHTIHKLPDEQAGKLFKIILDYVNDNDPVVDDLLLDISFEPIRQQLKRDLTKWTEKAPERSEKARKAGLASAESRRLKPTKVNSLVQNELEPTKSTVSVSVNDNVKDSITPKGVLVIWDNIKKSYNPKSKETSLTESRRKAISVRIKEGNGSDQFEGTIKYMFSKWYTDTNMTGYLTPETILGTKFTKYLEEARENKNKKQPHEIGKGDGGFSMMEAYEQNKPK
jgi:uncharacterized phage protein (TIGR02220 family)